MTLTFLLKKRCYSILVKLFEIYFYEKAERNARLILYPFEVNEMHQSGQMDDTCEQKQIPRKLHNNMNALQVYNRIYHTDNNKKHHIADSFH